MAVQKWTWNGTNPSSQKPTIGSVAFDATAEQTRRAYQTLLSKGPTSDFDRRVWNDLCGKILDLNVEWCSQNYFTSSSPVWVQSVGKKLSANAMNTATDAIFTNFDRPWEEELRRRYLQRGDICKAEYFLWMAEAINKWCELTPLFFSFSDAFDFWISSRARLGISLPIYPKIANHSLHIAPFIRLHPSIPFSVWLDMNWVNEKQNFLILPSVPMSSLMNFYKVNISVLARNGIVLEALPKPLVLKCDTEAFALACKSIEFSTRFDFRLPIEVDAWVCHDLIPLYPHLDMLHGSTVGFVLPYAIGVESADEMFHRDVVRVRRFRSLPLSFNYGYYHNGGATFDFDYSTSFYTGGGLGFRDNNTASVAPSASFENSGGFGISGYSRIATATGKRYSHTGSFLLQNSQEFNSPGSRAMDSVSVITPTGTHRLGTGNADARRHSGAISTRHTSAFAEAPVDAYRHQGAFKTSCSFAMDFSEEIEMAISAIGFGFRNNQINIAEAPARDIVHNGIIQSRENISLLCAETMEVSGSGEVRIPYFAGLQTNRACLLGGNGLVRTHTNVELISRLNSNIEPKPQEVITRYDVLLDALQQTSLAADIEASTIERGALVALHGSVLDSEAIVEATSRSDLVAKRAAVIAGESGCVASSVATAATILPKHISAIPCIVGTESRAILDLCYPVDDTFGATARIEVETDAVIVPISSGVFFEAQNAIATEEQGSVELMPISYMESKNQTGIETDATLILVKVHHVLASELEEELVTDLDGILAEELDRRFIFETGG